MERTVLLKKFS